MAHPGKGTRIVQGLLAMGLTWWAPALFAEESTPQQTLRGEIIDPATYLKEGRRGPELMDQTYEAVDGGQSLALLDEATSTVYLLIADSPGMDPNDLVYDYVNQTIGVTGRVYERDGLHGIVVTSVNAPEPLPTSTGTPAAPPAKTTPPPVKDEPPAKN